MPVAACGGVGHHSVNSLDCTCVCLCVCVHVSAHLFAPSPLTRPWALSPLGLCVHESPRPREPPACRLLIYGEYCSRMEHAQSTLSQLLASREDFRQKVEVRLPSPFLCVCGGVRVASLPLCVTGGVEHTPCSWLEGA